MNYEKAYKEALNKAKSKIENDKGHVLYEDDIKEIFHELAESEGEQIRKALISILKSDFENDTTIYDISVSNIIAWLEKQGEQKPQGKQALEVWKDMRLEVYQQASGNRRESNYSDDSTKMFSLIDIDEIFEKVAEKQGEQKSAWSEEDEKFVVDTMNVLYRAKNQYAQTARLEECIDWLKSLKDRIKGE